MTDPRAEMITPRRKEKIAKTVAARQQGILVLEDIFDPHNAEAVFRSCDAFGFQKVYLIFEEQVPFNPRKMGKATSSSANKWLSFTIFDSTEECMKQLKEDGYETVATVLSDRAESMYGMDLSNPKIALILGNEHRGLSQTAIDMADKHIIIPMRGMVQSLNLSVTGAICLFEISRQRVEKGLEYYALPPEEQAKLRETYYIKAV